MKRINSPGRSRSGYVQRKHLQTTIQQRWLAVLFWFLTLLLALFLNRNLAQSQPADIGFFVILHTLSAFFTVRLPSGAYVGLSSITVIAGALLLGYQAALLLPILATLLVIPLNFVLKTIAPHFPPHANKSNYEVMWDAAGTALSLLSAGWLYTTLGGSFSESLTVSGQLWATQGFILLYFGLRVLFILGWSRLAETKLPTSWETYNWLIIITHLFLTAIFAPLLAESFSRSQEARLLGLISYGMSAVLLHLIMRTQLRLSARNDDLRILNSIGQALNANIELDDLLQAIHGELSKLLDVSSFYLALYDRDTNSLHFPIIYEEGKKRSTRSRPFVSNGLTEHIIKTRRPLLLRDDPQAELEKMGLQSHGRMVASYLGVPVATGDDVLGVLALRHFAQHHAYDNDDKRLLETIASTAGIALQNARFYQKSQRQASELSLLNKVSALVSASLDLDEALEALCRMVIDVMTSQKAAVFLIDPTGETVELRGSVGLSESFQQQLASLPIDAPRAIAAHSNKTIIIEDVNKSEQINSEAAAFQSEDIHAILEVPLRLGSDVIGSLAAYFETPRQFEPNEIELMDTLAGQVAIAAENARLFQTISNRRRELEALYQTGRAVNSTLSLPLVLEAITGSMLEVLDIDVCVTLLADDKESALHTEMWQRKEKRSASKQLSDDFSIPLDAIPAIDAAVRDHEPRVVNTTNLTVDGSLYKLMDRYGISVGLLLPLIMHGNLIGLTIAGKSKRDATLSPETVRLARALADQAAVAVQNARLFERTDVALASRVDQLSALEMLAQRMTRRLELQAVIEQLVGAAVAATDAEIAELLMYDADTHVMRQLATHGSQPDEDPKVWPADNGLVGKAIKTGEPVLVGDVREEDEYIKANPGVLSELAVPIQIDNQRLGVINLESTRLNAFDRDHERFIVNLAEHAAIAIQNARLFESIQQRAQEFQTLRAVALDLLSSNDLHHTLQVIAREALNQTQSQDIHIYIYDEENGELEFGTSLWEDGNVDREFAKPRPDGITATVARSGERVIVRDPDTHPLFRNVKDQPKWEYQFSIASVPLKQGEQVIGVFNIAFAESNQITDEVLHFLDLLAAQAAVAISNARLVDETRTHRNRLQAILDSINDGILMFDMEGRMVMANPRVEWLLNVRIKNHIGQHFLQIMDVVADRFEDIDAFKRRQVLKLVRGIRENPYPMTRRSYSLTSPSFRMIEEQSIAVLGHDDELMGRLFILRDVTREHEISLFRQEMSHMLVHDLRSPLAGMITGLALAADELSMMPEDDHQAMVAASLDVALTGANGLLRLVEEILDVNKLEAGEVPLVRKEIEVETLVTQAVRVLKGTAAEANISLHVDIPDEVPNLVVDTDKIERVLINLIDNALRYTPQGGEIWVRGEDADAHVTISVIDTGEGIPAELRERIFDRFVQGDPTTRKRGTKGSGLGLTFCKLAVEAHGGRIWIDNAPKGGAAFQFTLPKAG